MTKQELIQLCAMDYAAFELLSALDHGEEWNEFLREALEESIMQINVRVQ